MKQNPSRAWRRRIVGVSVILLLLAAGGGVVAVTGWPWHPVTVDAGHAAPEFVARAPQVKTIRPKLDKTFRVTSRQLATVEPFLEAELRARASGVVRFVRKEIGERVIQGELLIEIDVPDLEQDVRQKDSVIDQRKLELRLAEVKIKDAEALVEAARATVLQKQTDVVAAEATRDRQQKRYARYKDLAARNSISPDLVDEQERDTVAAVAALDSARAAVQKAQADLTEKKVGLEVAQADVDLKGTLVTVAVKDRDKARALADYARITAPFDGVVTRRNVDVGDFVQNATTGQSTPLLNVARTDFVTVVAHLPDNVAPFVSQGTTVNLTLDDLPGLVLEAGVTRLAPSLSSSDRTMRIEVDLFNGTEPAYGEMVGRALGRGLAALGGPDAMTAAGLIGVSQNSWSANSKGMADGIPARPRVTGHETDYVRLLPGMTGYVNVQMQQFRGAFLLPSGAIYSRGGKSYILEVRDGVSHEVPVRVQVNDGILAKVATLTKVGGIEEARELTGAEEVIGARQVEIGDNRPVSMNHVDW